MKSKRGINHPSVSRSVGRNRAAMELLENRRLLSTTYYVSPSGSDTNNGTSPSTPWQTVAKVNGATFSPGDDILFQYGSQFHASLTASSSGTVAAPITYGAYGDSTLAHPLFIGSDPLDNSAFTLVTGTTYSMSMTTPVFWVYENGAFMHESTDVLSQNGGNSGDPTSNINSVEANADQFYYDTSTTTLYVNPGAALAAQTFAATTREDAVSSGAQSNLVFTDLDVSQTAHDNAGYGVRVQASSNVQISNMTATQTGKHAFGVIDSTGFVGTNLTANGSNPDLGFGGASAFVSYSDATRTGDTSVWTNCTYINPNGYYEIFISHSDTAAAIASLSLTNFVSEGGYGTGIDIQSSGSTERVTITGGQIGGGEVEVDTDNSVIQDMTFDQPLSSVQLDGSNDVIQNCIFNGLTPNINSGRNGVADSGTDNIIRFNTFDIVDGPGIYVLNPTTNTDIYGNIFDNSQPIGYAFVQTPTFTSNYNVFEAGAQFITGGIISTVLVPLAQWQAMGFDTNSVVGDPQFVDAATGNFVLQENSPAIDLYKGVPDQSVATITTDIAGDARPIGAGYDAGAYEYTFPNTGSLSLSGTSLPAPLAGTTAPAVFNLSLSAAQIVPITVQYTTVDDTAVAGTDYTATSGTLTFAPGVTSQTISVPVNASLAANSTVDFTLALSNLTPSITLTTATAVATISDVGESTLNFNRKTPGVYTDSAGKKVSLKLGGVGAGEALFLSGNADPEQILITGSAPSSTFSATSIGGVTTLEDILVQGSIGSITTTANVTGSVEVTGTISKLTLGSVAGQILLDGATGRTSLKVAALTSGELLSASPITSITAASWQGNILAPTVATLSVKGAFSGNVNLSSGVLGTAKVGSVTGGVWTLPAGIHTLAVTGAATDLSLNSSTSIGTITVGSTSGSSFFAGLDTTTAALPTSISVFTTKAQITSFTDTKGFADSFVGAAAIHSVKVAHVTTDNNGIPFGIATQSLLTLSDVETGKKTFTWSSKKNTIAQLTFSGDFKVVGL